MGLVLAYDQFGGSSVATGVASLPAGSNLRRARLSCFTSFSSQNTTVTFQFAPPNTTLGIAWVPHGTAIPVIDFTNWKSATWAVAGPGRLLSFDRSVVLDRGQTPVFLYLQHTYSNEIELQFPLFNAAAFDLGISINFQGGGFWSSNVPWISYQFEAYFD